LSFPSSKSMQGRAQAGRHPAVFEVAEGIKADSRHRKSS
jgi:hypothetical protein